MKKSSESSRREKPHHLKEKNMKTNTENRDMEIESLMRMRDEDIDTSDIPEVRNWNSAVMGKFFRPIKAPITIRLDLDIVTWLKSEGPGYQTRINAFLRRTMTEVMTGRGTLEGSEVEASADPDTEESGPTANNFRFPNLERKHELEKCSHIADLIKKRRSVFAPAA